ncbi:MAG: PatB family C-S lyase [Bacteroidales bacterium]|nr:PatB family C-S lyase [Bacteroidales bacterium]
MYDFDKITDRKGTGSFKYDRLEKFFGKADLIPLWVADMEFETPSFITDAVKKRMEHPIYGYTITDPAHAKAICKWELDRHSWAIQEEWISFIPGIVKGIGLAVRALLSKSEKVVIQPPVYHPFHLVPEACGIEVARNPLIELPEGGYKMDLPGLEALLESDSSCKLLILCNPHNPAGIVWEKDTLKELASICKRHGITVISDEIHCDIALFGHKHIPFASVSDEAASISITFSAPSKTFNMAGFASSFAVVPDKTLREKFFGWMEACELNEPDIFASIAATAAYTHGEPWREKMVGYIEGNVLAVEEFCKEHIPGIKPVRPQASFLVWLDCRALGLSHDELVNLFVDKAGLALNDGAMFGREGNGFMRLNIGCPRKLLIEALEKLAKALKS